MRFHIVYDSSVACLKVKFNASYERLQIRDAFYDSVYLMRSGETLRIFRSLKRSAVHPDSNNLDHLTACPDCDLLMPKTEAPPGHSLLCPRCGKTINRRTNDSIVKALALSIAGLLMYPPAILLPLMTMESFGFSDSANIIDSIVNFYQNGYYLVSFMVLLSAVIFPLVLLSSVFIISFQLYRHRYPWYLARLFRAYLHLEEWAMVEVYLLGIMVTVIKMGSSTDISYNTGIFCFTGLVLLTIAIAAGHRY